MTLDTLTANCLRSTKLPMSGTAFWECATCGFSSCVNCGDDGSVEEETE